MRFDIVSFCVRRVTVQGVGSLKHKEAHQAPSRLCCLWHQSPSNQVTREQAATKLVSVPRLMRCNLAHFPAEKGSLTVESIKDLVKWERLPVVNRPRYWSGRNQSAVRGSFITVLSSMASSLLMPLAPLSRETGIISWSVKTGHLAIIDEPQFAIPLEHQQRNQQYRRTGF